MLDFGAGRGKFAEIDVPGVRVHTDLTDRTSRLTVFDVDEAVLENIESKDRHYAPVGAPLPFEDASFDLIYCTWVAEHIADPEFYCAEISRVLKPGGWFCALTPNKWGIIAIGGRLIPNSLHTAVLKWLVPGRNDQDTFPTTYRLNTIGHVRKYFPGWTNASMYWTGPPSYHANRMFFLRCWLVLSRILPNAMSPLVMIYVQKPVNETAH